MKKLFFLMIMCYVTSLCFASDICLKSLVAAIEEGDIVIAEHIIYKVSSASELGIALCVATYCDNVAMVKLLLQKRNLMNQADIEAALSSAESVGQSEIINLLKS